MTYIALLRGINVGGNKKVSMAQLKEVFDSLGCERVKTYINSGNVLFNDARSGAVLHPLIEDNIREKFGFEVNALVIDKPTLDRIGSALPSSWRNDDAMKCDVMFLWDEKNTPNIVKDLPIKPDIDNVIYVDGALLWSVAREHITKSGMLKLVGTELYKKITIRNCNTVRKLIELAAQQ